MKGTKLSLSGNTSTRRNHTDTPGGQGVSPLNTRQKPAPVETLRDASQIPDRSVVHAAETQKTIAVSSERAIPTELKDESSQIHEPASVSKRQRATRRHSPTESQRSTLAKRRDTEPGSSAVSEQRVQDNAVQGDSVLYAKEAGRDETTRVRVILDGVCLNSPVSGDISVLSQLGNDGNQFWCQVCHEFGNVVCCDGCPRVYHKECIPLDNVARTSLDRDEDPWYCPECIEDSVPTTFPEVDATPSKASVENSEHDLHCKDCGNKVDTSSGSELNENEEAYIRCSSCRSALDTVNGGEEKTEIFRKKRSRTSSYIEDVNEGQEKAEDVSMDRDEEDNKQENDGQRKLRKRQRADSVVLDKPAEESKLKTKKKQKPPKKNRAAADQAKSPTNNANHANNYGEEEEEISLSEQGDQHSDLVRATPAFYFYLAENRWKIERVLGRKHRYFNRLPKGNERNELVAREAAMWWVKLRPVDHRRYMTMSMRDFEARTIEWKEEKNLRDIIDIVTENDQDSSSSDNANESILTNNGNHIESDVYSQRFQDAFVGTKPFLAEPGDTHNKIVYELLHDLRFGKCPLVEANRVNNTTVIDEHAKSLIPYFEVHGPLSTSIGDECLGCSRGWKHYCHVLNRPIPAIDPRAKLQPPLSSLVATRVGLGLRPRIEREQNGNSGHGEPEDDKIPPFLWRTSKNWEKLQDLPVLPSSSLGESSDRFDDVAVFIEDITTMRTSRLTVNWDATSNEDSLFICDRCGACTEDKAGCIRCRRAQLVINLSKKQPAGSEFSVTNKADEKALKVQTIMLGRVQGKDGPDGTLLGGEQHLSSKIMKSRWAPLAILPPRALTAPSKTRTFDCVEDNETTGSLAHEEESHQYEDSVNESETPPGVQGENSFLDLDNHITPSSNMNQTQGRSLGRVRQPPARLLVSSTSNKDYGDPDRQKLERRKGRSDAFEFRCTTVACYGILLSSLRRDPLRLLARPIMDKEFVKFNRNSIHFGAIQENVLDQSYDTVGGLVTDIERMCKAIISFYPVQSALCKCAKDIQEALEIATSRTTLWMNALLTAHQKCLFVRERNGDAEPFLTDENILDDERFEELRDSWPGAVEMLEDEDALRSQIEATFMRTQENERAYYGSLVVKRAAAAASTALAPRPNSTREYAVVVGRDSTLDEELRVLVDQKVASVGHLVDLHQVPCPRETSILNLLRKMQKKRIERRSHAESACSRCLEYDASSDNSTVHTEEKRKQGDYDHRRIDSSRCEASTGLASTLACISSMYIGEFEGHESAGQFHSCVSVRPSRIHGLGLFADQHFKKDQIVVEYIGEYIGKEAIISRRQEYHEARKRDFIICITDASAIDATTKGGPARFINHSCLPNCAMNFVETADERGRLFLVASKDIRIHDEITYDYKKSFSSHEESASEVDLESRVPCNCQSKSCRGFMNWNLPENVLL